VSEVTDVITFKIMKKLPNGNIMYDKHRRPWFSPWKPIISRSTVTQEQFEALSKGHTIEGSI